MARRRKNEGLADLLIILPWWVSAVLACVGFAAMRWIVPSMINNNLLLKGIAPVFQSMAWVPLALFGITGLIAFARSKASLASVPAHTGLRTKQRPRIEPTTYSQPPKSNITGDRSNQHSDNPATIIHVLDTWTIEALRELEWKRFELVCAKYYEVVGFKSKTIRCGADGGIDVKLFKIDPSKPLAIVQCKAWNTYSVGVKEVRELLGVMAHEKVGRGIFITTGTYTKDALHFGTANPIQLLDGAGFLKKIQELSNEHQNALFKYAFEGDYKTPTCASCGIKMIKRDSKRGPFWGCQHFPQCRSTFAIKN